MSKINNLEDLFLHLENISAVSHSCMEFGLYSICPPSFKNKDEWTEITSFYPISLDILNEMYKSGFEPLDRDLYLKKTCSNDPYYGYLQKDENYIIVDHDYGIFLYHKDKKLTRLNLDLSMFNRYSKTGKSFKQEDMLDVGANRGQFITGNFQSKSTDIVEYNVNSRSELNDIISMLNERVKSFPNIELWYRGQPNDYLMTDYTNQKYNNILPYRKVRDSSLVPSLFRLKSLNENNLGQYYTELEEIQKYISHLSMSLGIREIIDRENDGKIKEFFNHSAWGLYDTGMTFHRHNQEGKLLSIGDSYPGFFALQKSFFLQHYGIPSPVLDITSSLDISLFFSQNSIDNGKYTRVSFDGNKPVLYIFALDKQLDLFLPSDDILHEHKLLRPQRQKCGMLVGSSILTRNHYARFIAIKIKLNNFIEYDQKITPEYLFPSAEEDDFLRKMIDVMNFEKMEFIKPFYLK